VKLIAFCEAVGDFRLLTGLVERVLRDKAPTWVVDNLDTPGAWLRWHAESAERDFFDIHRLNQIENDLQRRGVRVRSVRGHFDGQPGGAGSAMARKVFHIVEALNRKDPTDPIEALVLLWDIDQRSERRPDGVAIARDHAKEYATFKIVCGFPDPESEAWILAGIEPSEADAQQRLDAEHRALTFSPVAKAHLPRDKDDGALRNAKRVLHALIGGDRDRQQRCWTEPPLARLRQHGTESGLAAFLDEIEAELLPLVDPSLRAHRQLH
jgi:hypothetical protein